MTDIGELVVRIKADAAQLEREMRKANGIVKQSAGEMGGAFGKLKQQILELAPAISAVALVEFGRRAIDAAGHIVDLADRIGFASSTLSALEAPLVTSGSNLDEFGAAVNKMNNLLGEAAKGNEEAIKAFDGLGLSVKRLRALSPEDQFYAIASAIGQITDQNKQTEAGMNIFGRGFASLIPLLKEYEGDMRKAVEAQEKMKNGLSDDTLKRIDAFGDSLSAAGIKAKNSFLEAFGAILKVTDKISEITAKPATNAKSGMPGENPLPDSYIKKAQENGFVTSAKFVSVGNEQFGPAQKSTDARGSNADLLGLKEKAEAAKKLADARKTLDDYNLSLERQNKILHESPREQAALAAMYKTMDLAAKAGIKDANDLILANMQLARTNYDLAESMQEAARFQQELHDKLSSTLTDIAFKAGSASEAMLGFAESIAKAAFEQKVAGPLADALVGKGGSKGLLDDAIGGAKNFFGGFFADGGAPPIGVPSIVGERGPEIFVPNAAGTIIPNGKIGGNTVVVQQTINMSPGLPETVNAAIRNAAPQIAGMAHASVFAAMQNGGGESRIAGRRS
ncbi:hypothetical protein P12x_005247 [Tundrisphaera lichenicola]|uniref:hypothetical protein n=1 Tax=Tundrisphaera lichenicola TaxID=2029860 RepID=UPI003EBD77F4